MVWSDPLSLATTHGVSLPAGTEMFHFPAYPRNNKVPCRPMTAGGLPHSEILGSKPCWRLPEAYRILKRPSSVLSAKASTIRPSGRHTPRKTLMIASNADDKSSHCKNITKRSISKPDSKKEAWRNRDKASRTTILHCSRPSSSSQTTTPPTGPTAALGPTASARHPETARTKTDAGGGPEPKSIPIPLPARPQGNPRSQRSLPPSTPTRTWNHPRRMGHMTDARPAS